MTLTADFHDAWVAELDRLEVDVALAEAMLAADHMVLEEPAPWALPEMRGPLPADLDPVRDMIVAGAFVA